MPRYMVSFYKTTEGGPSTREIIRVGKERGLKIVNTGSCYVGQTGVVLVKGSKRDYRRVLREFGVGYL